MTPRRERWQTGLLAIVATIGLGNACVDLNIDGGFPCSTPDDRCPEPYACYSVADAGVGCYKTPPANGTPVGSGTGGNLGGAGTKGAAGQGAGGSAGAGGAKGGAGGAAAGGQGGAAGASQSGGHGGGTGQMG